MKKLSFWNSDNEKQIFWSPTLVTRVLPFLFLVSISRFIFTDLIKCPNYSELACYEDCRQGLQSQFTESSAAKWVSCHSRGLSCLSVHNMIRSCVAWKWIFLAIRWQDTVFLDLLLPCGDCSRMAPQTISRAALFKVRVGYVFSYWWVAIQDWSALLPPSPKHSRIAHWNDPMMTQGIVEVSDDYELTPVWGSVGVYMCPEFCLSIGARKWVS
jgi:hypothetical protein